MPDEFRSLLMTSLDFAEAFEWRIFPVSDLAAFRNKIESSEALDDTMTLSLDPVGMRDPSHVVDAYKSGDIPYRATHASSDPMTLIRQAVTYLSHLAEAQGPLHLSDSDLITQNGVEAVFTTLRKIDIPTSFSFPWPLQALLLHEYFSFAAFSGRELFSELNRITGILSVFERLEVEIQSRFLQLVSGRRQEAVLIESRPLAMEKFRLPSTSEGWQSGEAAQSMFAAAMLQAFRAVDKAPDIDLDLNLGVIASPSIEVTIGAPLPIAYDSFQEEFVFLAIPITKRVQSALAGHKDEHLAVIAQLCAKDPRNGELHSHPALIFPLPAVITRSNSRSGAMLFVRINCFGLLTEVSELLASCELTGPPSIRFFVTAVDQKGYGGGLADARTATVNPVESYNPLVYA